MTTKRASQDTHLYIIRHGQALSAVEKTIANTRLSPLGVKQAEHLRDRLAATGEIRADMLISSTMKRAQHTAEIIAPALGLPVTFDEQIEEWRDGEEGEKLSIEEYQRRFDAVPMDEKPYMHIAPGAETWVEFMLRVGTAIHRIIHEHEGKTIVLVCHGGIVDASFFFFLGLSTLQFPRAFFNTHNTSITHWFKSSIYGFEPHWVLERYNDVMHLRDIDTVAQIPWQELRSSPTIGKEQAEVPSEALE